jgi:hypothetical protein
MPKRTTLDWVLEAASLAVLVAIFINLAAHWPELPNRVPHHYGFAGNPNGWGGKNWMWVLPVTAAGIFILLTLSSYYPRLINLPVSVDRESPPVRKLLLTMSGVLKLTTLLILGYINWAGINIALGRARGISPIFLPVVLLVTFGPIVFYTKKLQRYRI